jgi:hypothetical protein
MAQYRAYLSKGTKKRLVAEAGGKCANPGCLNRRTEFHHIREWAVYATHDEAHMIALCPTCHTHAHYGDLKITDEDLYRWKAFKRRPSRVDHIAIEPSEQQKLLLGSIAVTGQHGIQVLKLSETNFLSFLRRDDDLMFLNIGVSDLEQKPLLSVTENIVRYKDERIYFNSIPGHIKVTAQLSTNIIPFWLPNAMRQKHASCIVASNILVIELKVTSPGVVKVDGIWCDHDNAVVVSDGFVTFYPGGFSITGQGEHSVLYYGGPIDSSFFGKITR